MVFSGGLRVFGVDVNREANGTFLDYTFDRRKGELWYGSMATELPAEVKKALESSEALKQLGEAQSTSGSDNAEIDIHNVDTKGWTDKEKVALSKFRFTRRHAGV